MIETRMLTSDDWALWRELRLIALAESPEAFGSRLADWQAATEDRWRRRLDEVACNVMAFEQDGSLGMASGVDEGEQVELISMYVRPAARGRGVADALIECVVGWARDRGAHSVYLSVREDNAAAKRVYRRHGFVETGPASGGPDDAPEDLMARALTPGGAREPHDATRTGRRP